MLPSLGLERVRVIVRLSSVGVNGLSITSVDVQADSISDMMAADIEIEVFFMRVVVLRVIVYSL